MGIEHKGMVKSDETLFAIIESLKETNGAGVTELANRLGLSKSAVHKHLNTMAEHGYAVKKGEQYHIGLRFLSHGEYALNQYEVYHAAKPILQEVTDETGEMSWLFTEENGRGVFLEGVVSEGGINRESILGSRFYLHSTAGGKAILSEMTRDEVTAIIERHGLPERAGNTITDEEALFEELAEIRERGYATNFQENQEGVHAIAVPISVDGDIHGSIVLSGAAHRITQARCEDELSGVLLAAANDIELNLVYQ